MVIKILNDNKITRRIDVKEDTDIILVGVNGGDLDLSIMLKHPGVCVNMYGILVGAKDQKYNIQTVIHHMVQETKSHVHIKGVFYDKSQFIYDGMIKIGRTAFQSSASLRNDNLVVGEDPLVDTSPKLEILTDDVTASHAVTISTLDEMQKYYLQSRGLHKQDVERILIKGFINEIVEHAESKVDISELNAKL